MSKHYSFHAPTVAEYLDRQISKSRKSQIEIARVCGFETPNMITMLKQGRTKLPLAKVGPMARALEVDPAYLLRLALREYLPETYAAIETVMSPALLTENEMGIINAFRRLTLFSDPGAQVLTRHGIVAIVPEGWE
jgi:transcriptional regulator with XRE-family HTH domain